MNQTLEILTHPLTLLGIVGQLAFFMRFFVQWIASERRKQSVIPVSFWYFSLLGSVLLLAYSIYRHDPVFIFGQSVGFVIYTRNLVLLSRRPAREVSA